MDVEGRGDIRLLFSFGVPNHTHLQLVFVVGQPAQDVSGISVGNARGRIVTVKKRAVRKRTRRVAFPTLDKTLGAGRLELFRMTERVRMDRRVGFD